MFFDRVKSLDQIIKGTERKSLSRDLGPVQLTLLGVGAIIGTGIFVLTSEAAQIAGPGMMISFILAAVVCALAALAYSELAAMIPVAGSAYTFSYGVLGERIAWMVGWALVLEYAVAAAAVAVGWSKYMNGVLASHGWGLPEFLRVGLNDGGVFNLLAFLIAIAVSALLVVGTSKSAKVNAGLVVVKLVALVAFVALAVPAAKSVNFEPFLPTGVMGVSHAAALIFFAFVGFDAVSTAAEETRNPDRNIPIGLIGSFAVCTVFYMLIGYGAVGAFGAQPLLGASGLPIDPGTAEMVEACKLAANKDLLVCSGEPLAHILRQLGFVGVGDWVGIAASVALPSVILMMIYGQTRIFFVMSRDGLLPEKLSQVHPKFKTPHVITWITGIAVAIGAAMFPVGVLASISNSGTLFAFISVGVCVLVLRKTDPNRPRPFRMPMAWVICPLAILGCSYLFFSLGWRPLIMFTIWTSIGLIIYSLYSRKRSLLA